MRMYRLSIPHEAQVSPPLSWLTLSTVKYNYAFFGYYFEEKLQH